MLVIYQLALTAPCISQAPARLRGKDSQVAQCAEWCNAGNADRQCGWCKCQACPHCKAGQTQPGQPQPAPVQLDQSQLRGARRKAMLKPTLVRSSSVESVMVPACPVMVNNGASRTLRVALAMYGLVRHPCPEANIARVFFQPLRKVEGFNFQIDTFVATNVLTHAEEGGRPGAKVGSYEVVAQSEFCCPQQ